MSLRQKTKDSSDTHRLVLNLLTPVRNNWDATATLPQKTLLRISLLRDVLHFIHAEYSRLLVTGVHSTAEKLHFYEKNLVRLKEKVIGVSEELPEDFEDLITYLAAPHPHDPVSTPFASLRSAFAEDFVQRIDPEKLFRQDRGWELALALEAIRNSWSFWTLTCSVYLYELEIWHKGFEQKLWPNGALLWTENGQRPESNQHQQQGQSEVPASKPSWRGVWTVVLAPALRNPLDSSSESCPIPLGQDILTLPGGNNTLPYEWKLIYP